MAISIWYTLFTSKTQNCHKRKVAIKKCPPGDKSPPKYDLVRITVTYDSITIHDNHEGFGEGTGKYNLFSFVQGKGIDLTKAAEFGVCGGDPDYCGGIWESSDGETIRFQPNSKVTLELDKTVPLSISALGFEVDGCDHANSLISADIRYPIQIFSNPRIASDWPKYIDGFIRDYYDVTGDCPFGEDNNELGAINEIYIPANGDVLEGRHSFDSSTGDYTLRFTISVEPILLPR